MIANTSTNSQLVMGINQLETGEAGLASGLRQGSAGQKTVISSMAQLKAGAGKIKAGQDTLYTGLTALSGGMIQLKDGVGKSSDGLGKINTGINKTNGFLNELTSTKSFYIPNEALGTNDIKQMFDAYMSKDRKTTKLTVNLNSDPYSPQSIKLIDQINNLVKNQLTGTTLANAKVGTAGITANTSDLKNVADHDILFTQIIVLACIFILLVLVLRSFWIPAYIVSSVLVAYYAATSVGSFLALKLFGIDGMSWNVPFFSFVIIAALGVDYSIFLMRRFKEYPESSPKEAIVLAAKNMGGVVTSAAIILAGTFATLYPSNLHLLMEMAICIVTGIFLLSTILLPIVIPALISIQDKISSKIIKAKTSKTVKNKEHIA